MNAIVIGSVTSSKIVLEELLKTDFEVLKVYSLDEQYSGGVSGYYPIHEIAEENGIPYRVFHKINEEVIIEELENLAPDYLFVVGLSQLVNRRIIDSARKGAVGFHPTPLPKYRGRAAMVWQMMLGVRETSCSLFFLEEGTDSGGILGQEEYRIEETDYALDVEGKLWAALRKLCTRIFPLMLSENLQPVRQKEEDATYLLMRTPEDGRIDWKEPIQQIHRLIRATSQPYPGAFADYEGRHKIIIWHAECLENQTYIGFPGQIANMTEHYLDVLCRDGLLRIDEYWNEDKVPLKIGHRFR